MFHLIEMSAVNIRGQSTLQSTCWACSSALTSLDGNLDTDKMLKHICVLCTHINTDAGQWTSRVSDSYGRLKALMLGVLTVSISGFLG